MNEHNLIFLNKFKHHLIWLWPILSCLVSGSAAVILDCPESWNSHHGMKAFISYAIPVPVANGTLHIPTLFISTLVLHANRVKPNRKHTIIFTAMIIIALTLVILARLNSNAGDPFYKMVFIYFAIDPILALTITRLPGKQLSK